MSKSDQSTETKKKSPESLAKKRREDRIDALEEALAHLCRALDYALMECRNGYEDYVRYYRALKGCEPDPGLVDHEWPEQDPVYGEDENGEDDDGDETK